MKKFKIVLWILIFGFIGIVIFQNPAVFMQKQALGLRLFVIDELVTPNLPVAVYFLTIFFCGLLVAYFFSLPERFRSRKTIKKLNERIVAHVDEIAEMKETAAHPAKPTPPVSQPNAR